MDGPAILARLQERFGAAILETHDYRGDHTAVVERAASLEVLRTTRPCASTC